MKRASQNIPVITSVDILVLGGGIAGVAAARAAALSGKRVFLAAPESYLGADLCATGCLWSQPDIAESGLPGWIMPGREINPPPAPRPMDVKRGLDNALLDAGVSFLLGCAPADLLMDASGKPSGAVLAFRAGRFAIAADTLIDATEHALAARCADIPFSRWNGGDVTFRQVVIGHKAEKDNGSPVRRLPFRAEGTYRGAKLDLDIFEYEITLPMPEWTPAALADARQTVYERTWHGKQVWRSDWPDCVSPVRIDRGRPSRDAGETPRPSPEDFSTPVPNLFVLGPCADITPALSARLRQPSFATMAGESLGRWIASASGKDSTRHTRSRPLHPSPASLHEPCTCDRFVREARHAIKPSVCEDSPSCLAEYDVVVVGGGTGGAPAALAAGRSGARVLLIESLHTLGGVGTAGCISTYYHGNRGGFTREVTEGLRRISEDVDFIPSCWNPEHKAEWFRRELRAAGVDIWFGSFTSGAWVENKQVKGVLVNTPLGRGIVRAGAIVDATGNSDVAAAAGAPCRTVSDKDLAIQGAGLPSRPFRPDYHNTDYLFIEDSDPVDITRAFVVARRKFAHDFDLAQMVDTRERRQILGDVTVTPLDVYTGRTWKDAICLSRSNFDSHGFTVHPLFVVRHPDRVSLDAWLPLRALLPRGYEGILVTGLGLSAQRDVMPVLRMQPDVQNHAFAAGLAAAMAAAGTAGRLRKIDVKELQRNLVRADILPQTALLHSDSPSISRKTLGTLTSGNLEFHSEIAGWMTNPRAAIPLLKNRLGPEDPAGDGESSLRIARLLAMLGDDSGEAILIRRIAESPWGEGWNYTGMGQFGRSLGPIDEAIVALANLRSHAGRAAVLEKTMQLNSAAAFSHFRAIALFAETLHADEFAPALAGLLREPDIGGHAWENLNAEMAHIPESPVDTTTRNLSLRELYLARALFRIGDHEDTGKTALQAYSRDIRGHYARHAAKILAEGNP